MQPGFKCLQPLLQHLVIIRRPPHAGTVHAAGPGIARDPARCRVGRRNRARRGGVIVRQTNNRRARPRERSTNLLTNKLFPTLVHASQIRHGTCTSSFHPPANRVASRASSAYGSATKPASLNPASSANARAWSAVRPVIVFSPPVPELLTSKGTSPFYLRTCLQHVR